MKLSQAKEYLPLIQAAAEGKTIQIYTPSCPIWQDMTGDVWGDLFGDDDSERGVAYRIKPEPRLRPWTAAEALGKSVFLASNAQETWMIYATRCGMFLGFTPAGLDGSQSPEWYLAKCKQLDGSPCGVEEVA